MALIKHEIFLGSIHVQLLLPSINGEAFPKQLRFELRINGFPFLRGKPCAGRDDLKAISGETAAETSEICNGRTLGRVIARRPIQLGEAISLLPAPRRGTLILEIAGGQS